MSFNMDIVGGTVASLCEAYREIVRFDSTGHWINLLFDHETDEIQIRSPYTHDCLEIELRKPGPLFVRIPSWVVEDQITIEGYCGTPRRSNGYLFLSQPPVGSPIRISFPLAEWELTLSETVHVNPIRVRMRGDSVDAMENFGVDLTFFDAL